MSTIAIDAPWVPLTPTASRLVGGRELNGVKQFVCATDHGGVIGKLIGDTGYFAINGKEVARKTGLHVLSAELTQDKKGTPRQPAWFKWTAKRSSAIVGSGVDYTITTEVSDGDDPVTESSTIVRPVNITRFSYRDGIHIGHAWFAPSGELITRFSYGGGVVEGETPLAYVGWGKAFNEIPPWAEQKPGFLG
jgi:hypothetical protein